MVLFAEVTVIASSLFVIGLATLIFVNPTLAKRFILSFASSSRAHYIEMVFRLLFGIALVLLSQVMWQPRFFLVLGLAIVVSSLALLVAPWQWHQRVGTHVLPLVIRYMRVYALGMFAFGSLLLFSVYSA